MGFKTEGGLLVLLKFEDRNQFEMMLGSFQSSVSRVFISTHITIALYARPLPCQSF